MAPASEARPSDAEPRLRIDWSLAGGHVRRLVDPGLDRLEEAFSEPGGP